DYYCQSYDNSLSILF
nr:immunoglobulin light chain junction region [Macaca mulatta]